MPKIVDHDQRRGEVLEATWRVIRRSGLEGATVREIAREAGFSNGVLAHYFKDKNDILVKAHQLAFDRVYERVSRATSEKSGIELLRTMLYEALPLDEERLIEAVVDVSFLGRALYDADLKSVRLESAASARIWWAAHLTRLREENLLKPDVDIELVAGWILAMIDGVSVQAVLFPELMDAALQQRIADDLVLRICS